VGTSKSSTTESPEVTERSSSRTEKPVPELLFDESQEEEKMEEPNGFERPPLGSVNEPDLKRLFLSVRAGAGAGWTTVVEE
jgi:hypothetical protein